MTYKYGLLQREREEAVVVGGCLEMQELIKEVN